MKIVENGERGNGFALIEGEKMGVGRMSGEEKIGEER